MRERERERDERRVQILSAALDISLKSWRKLKAEKFDSMLVTAVPKL